MIVLSLGLLSSVRASATLAFKSNTVAHVFLKHAGRLSICISIDCWCCDVAILGKADASAGRDCT